MSCGNCVRLQPEECCKTSGQRSLALHTASPRVQHDMPRQLALSPL